jgi:hypothetical protein
MGGETGRRGDGAGREEEARTREAGDVKGGRGVECEKRKEGRGI